MKVNVTSTNNGVFKTHESHSAEEILAAGGATAFGRKTGKNNESLISALENLAPAEPFSQEEWDGLMAQIESTK
jgi:hypothetical protein